LEGSPERGDSRDVLADCEGSRELAEGQEGVKWAAGGRPESVRNAQCPGLRMADRGIYVQSSVCAWMARLRDSFRRPGEGRGLLEIR
jgi:hypothetical protein